MDKTVTTALLIMVSMVLSIMLFNVAYPAVQEGGDAINNMSDRADEQMKSQVRIVHAAGELDSTGAWQDVNTNGQFEAFVWVKNTGSTRITGFEQTDVFFGPEGNFVRIPHESHAGGSFPYWSAHLENDTAWTPTATLAITIHYQVPLSSGQYYIKVTVPNGVSDEMFVGM